VDDIIAAKSQHAVRQTKASDVERTTKVVSHRNVTISSDISAHHNGKQAREGLADNWAANRRRPGNGKKHGVRYTPLNSPTSLRVEGCVSLSPSNFAFWILHAAMENFSKQCPGSSDGGT
jgi:hypothetical protein